LERRACLAGALARERQVYLYPIGEQEDAVEEVAAHDVQEWRRVEDLNEIARPVRKNVAHRRVSGDAEREIKV
jgi:hypothetical protein